MKTYIATVQVEFTCRTPEMVHDRIIGIPFGDHDCGFRIVSIYEGKIPKGHDETLKPEYRSLHRCWPVYLENKP
jgi:hypothetical protein